MAASPGNLTAALRRRFTGYGMLGVLLLLLGVALRRSGDLEASEEAYRTALEIDPRTFQANLDQSLANCARERRVVATVAEDDQQMRRRLDNPVVVQRELDDGVAEGVVFGNGAGEIEHQRR